MIVENQKDENLNLRDQAVMAAFEIAQKEWTS
jgi:hypothetical protein